MKPALLVLCVLTAGAQAWFGASMRRLYNGPDSIRRAPSQLGDVGDPLFLTPLIEAGQLEQARNLSRVGSLGAVPDFPGYSGFLTVNKQYGSNLFFWFFPAKVGGCYLVYYVRDGDINLTVLPSAGFLAGLECECYDVGGLLLLTSGDVELNPGPHSD